MIFGEEKKNEVKSYEVIVESINPCGGSDHSFKEFLEIETQSPDQYVADQGRLPVTDRTVHENGDITITTGNAAGYMIRYTFTEI